MLILDSGRRKANNLYRPIAKPTNSKTETNLNGFHVPGTLYEYV